jgi:hypothetical protein
VFRAALVFVVDGKIKRSRWKGAITAGNAGLDAASDNNENFDTECELSVLRRVLREGGDTEGSIGVSHTQKVQVPVVVLRCRHEVQL